MILQQVQYATARGEEAAAQVTVQQPQCPGIAAIHTIGGAHPVAAIAVVQHHRCAGLRGFRPWRRQHRTIVHYPVQALVGAGPDATAAVAAEANDVLALQQWRVDPRETTIGRVPARQPGRRPHPHHLAAIGGQQRIDGVVRQTVRVIGLVLVMADAAIGMQLADAGAAGADQQVRAAAGQRPDLLRAGFLQSREALELLPVGIQHGQAGAITAHPYPVLGVDGHGFQRIARQRTRALRIVSPYPQLLAVIAGQAIIGGRPDIALAILRQGQHHPRRQTFGHAKTTQAWRLGQVRGDAPAWPQGQQHNTQTGTVQHPFHQRPALPALPSRSPGASTAYATTPSQGADFSVHSKAGQRSSLQTLATT
ncbi:hypothetical protein D3C81_826440 [compost metagenome]